jgi:outer membrane protein OmpA-like peptidoglycan-associated protein/tetratricopeptide (TPR) repeat protein
MKILNLFLLVALLALAQTAFAQPNNNNPSPEQKENIADEEREQNNSEAALEWYMNAYESNENDGNIIYKIASTHELLRDYKNAAEWYEKLVTLEMKDEFPLSKYQHANAMKMMGNYDGAIAGFEDFLKDYADDAPKADYYKAMARTQIEGAQWAKGHMEPEEELMLRNDFVINSNSTEGGAFPMGRNTILYTSLKSDSKIVVEEGEEYEKAKIYMAEADSDTTWKDPKEYNTDILQQDGLHVVQPVINKDRTKFYFVRAELVGNQLDNARIYVADYNESDGAVSNPKMLDFNSSSYSCKNPALATWDGRDYLLFVSNMEGGKGGTDIWYAELNADGTTKEPLNLEAVNTIGDEVTPFFDERNNSLYFSTDGLPGYGGWDIFETKRNADGTMGEIKNMGAGFNSYVDDFHFVVNKEGNDDCYGYLVSNRPGTKSVKESETCCDDIFSVIMPERCDIIIDVAIKDKDTGEPLIGATVQLVDKATGEVVDEQTNTAGNDYQFMGKMGREYDIVAYRDGDEGGREEVDLQKETLVAAGLDVTKPMTIQEVVMVEDQGLVVQVFNKRTNAPLEGVTVTIFDGSTGTALKVKESVGNSNEFKFNVPRNKNYKVFANRNGFVADTRIVQQNEMGNVQKLYLTPPPVFYNVYFDFDKSNIRPGAADTLDIVYRTLTENQEMVVEVRGHTDAKGTESYNVGLSDRRADAAIDYLAKKGVKESRLIPKAFGEEVPAADNTKPNGEDNPAGRALNRRVEFKIVDGTLGYDDLSAQQRALASTPIGQTVGTGKAGKMAGDTRTAKANKMAGNTTADKVDKMNRGGNEAKTTLGFATPVMKVGPIKFGESKEYTVEFTNTGNNDFKIFHLEGGCTCTEPVDWTRGAVKPGEKGFIKFKFDSSKAKVDPAYASSLNIYGNVPDDMILYDIEANVTK